MLLGWISRGFAFIPTFLGAWNWETQEKERGGILAPAFLLWEGKLGILQLPPRFGMIPMEFSGSFT